MQISTKQSSVSLIKRKGGAYKGQFSRLHLAVYPFEVEFLQNTEYQTFFLFEKNYQIIGEIKGLVPMCEKGSKYELRNAMNLIYFKLFESTNITYKWSAYKKYRNGQEEYLESCTLNLKEAVNNFIVPQKNAGQSMLKSTIQFGFNATQIRLKFPKTGLILMFMLFVSDDAHQIKDYVQERMLKKDENFLLPSIPLLAPSKSENNSGILGLSPRINQNSANTFEGIPKKQSNKRIKNQDLLLESNQKQNLKEEGDDSKKVSSLHDHIDNIIMKFDGNTGEIGQLKHEPNGSNLLQFQIEVTQWQKEERKQTQKNEQSENSKNNKKSEFAILKLQSDGGRANLAQIDQKLEAKQLQAIQEERTSKAGTFRSNNLTPRRDKKFEKLKETNSEIIMESLVVEGRFNLKKVGIYVVVSIFLILMAVNLKNLNKKGKKVNKK